MAADGGLTLRLSNGVQALKGNVVFVIATKHQARMGGQQTKKAQGLMQHGLQPTAQQNSGLKSTKVSKAGISKVRDRAQQVHDSASSFC